MNLFVKMIKKVKHFKCLKTFKLIKKLVTV
jgi:hypothetical protein